MWWPVSRKYPERCPEEVDTHEYDYIVVGGMSGNAIASLFTICRSVLTFSWDRWYRRMCLGFTIERGSKYLCSPSRAWYCQWYMEVPDTAFIIRHLESIYWRQDLVQRADEGLWWPAEVARSWGSSRWHLSHQWYDIYTRECCRLWCMELYGTSWMGLREGTALLCEGGDHTWPTQVKIPWTIRCGYWSTQVVYHKWQFTGPWINQVFTYLSSPFKVYHA